MSIIIKGMDKAMAESLLVKYPYYLDKIIEIPTPHGRLIDGDALMKTYDEESWSGYYCISQAPTILEAEE